MFPVEFNAYLVCILALMIGNYTLDALSNFLNASAFSEVLPDEFVGIYDPEKYRTSIQYQRARYRFDKFQKTFWLGATIAFILLGGFSWADETARGFGRGSIVTGLLFVGALLLLRLVAGLPFSIYDTFSLEERYGFNRTTPKTFVGDLVKGIALGTLIGGPIFSLIVWFFESAGSRGWLYSWIAFTLIQLLLSFLAPAVILPLFNKFEPLADGDLKTEIERFAQQQNFVLDGIFRMDSSKRSTKSNAFFTGFGKFRRLVLFDTLIEKHSREELVAVLAHEIGHFKRKHIQKGIVLSILVSGALFFALGSLIGNPGLFAAFGIEQPSVYASLVIAGFLFSPAARLLGIFTHFLSRKHEFEADSYALEAYGKPEILISALKKLSIDNLSNLTPHPMKVWLDYTHPPVLERIHALRR